MTAEQARKLTKFARENDIDDLEIIVALHIATDYCDEENVKTKYGTEACNGLRQLRDELSKPRQ